MTVMMSNLFEIELPKWPGLLVVGKRVTKEQAAEILVRTDNFHFHCNDWGFERGLYSLIGVSPNDYGSLDHEQLDAARRKYGVLPLDYLNNQRIASCYIGGPYGWCDWAGAIFCNSNNIGKWPKVVEVFDEWKRIAEAFPFLDLKCQLLNHEVGCWDDVTDPKPLVEFRVRDGVVTLVELTEQLVPDVNCVLVLSGKGCSLEQFGQALKLCGGKNA